MIFQTLMNMILVNISALNSYRLLVLTLETLTTTTLPPDEQKERYNKFGKAFEEQLNIRRTMDNSISGKNRNG